MALLRHNRLEKRHNRIEGRLSSSQFGFTGPTVHGGLSDKTVALNWNGARGRKRKLHLDEVTPVANNYHETVNQIQGDMRGSTFNFDRASTDPTGPPPPPPAPDSPCESTADPDPTPRESTADPDPTPVPPTPPIPQSDFTADSHTDPDSDSELDLDSEFHSDFKADSKDENEIDSPARLHLLCSSLSMWGGILHDKLTLPSGLILEEVFLPYASNLSRLDPSHGLILDGNLLSTLPPSDRSFILSRLQPLPTFPQHLYDALTTCTTTPPTVSQCRALAGNSSDRDLLWLSRVLEHTHELITHGLLSQDLTEGTYDSAVHPVLWDNYLLDLPLLLLRRKEIYLAAMTDNPYQLLPSEPRYDGVLRTRDRVDGYELALFEVSARYEATKWARDKIKLVVGGLPATMARLPDLAKVVAIAWKAKRVVAETAEVVKSYLRREEVGEVEVTGEDFL
ncbi:hypothetical protein Q9L58_002928 [Maublancomyces gigas]|uniref:Uncharacterized protein n=1 Tax=Discina gigas TaxID=1032678 RepID=A0ABR3GPY6_9PEZI